MWVRRRVSDDFPRWMEVSVTDADGREHRIVEKVPVSTRTAITSASSLPAAIWISADRGCVHDERVAVTFAAGVETVGGVECLTVLPEDVVWL